MEEEGVEGPWKVSALQGMLKTLLGREVERILKQLDSSSEHVSVCVCMCVCVGCARGAQC